MSVGSSVIVKHTFRFGVVRDDDRNSISMKASVFAQDRMVLCENYSFATRTKLD